MIWGLFRHVVKNSSKFYVNEISQCLKCKYSKCFQMQAIEFNPESKCLEVIEKEVPQKIKDTEVLIKVHYAGICGSDLHLIKGYFPSRKDPFTPGHEFSGIVTKTGKKVKHVKCGDEVVVDPEQCCMVCSACRSGNPHYCQFEALATATGIHQNGGWAQYCVVSALQVYKIPNCMTLKQAALCEPMSCIAHAWDRVHPVPISSSILILGCGIIGNLFMSFLHFKGYRRVTVTEPNENRLKLSENLDTEYDLICPNTLTKRSKKNKNYGFDIIIDSSGNEKAMEQALDLLNYGGKLVIFGVSNPNKKMCVTPYNIYRKEITIIGSLINPFCFPKALNYMKSMGDRYIDYDKLGIETFSLDEHENALSCLKAGCIAKATFEIDHH